MSEEDNPGPADKYDDGDWAYDQWKDKRLDRLLDEQGQATESPALF